MKILKVGWITILLVLIGVGIFGAIQVLTRDETPSVAWGLLLPSYVFFALAATGSSLVNSIFSVFNVKSFKPVIKRGVWLSLMLIIPAVIFVLLDLGKSGQMLNIYTLFHPASRMAWMGALYIAFGLSLAIEFIVVIREKNMPRWIPLLMGIIVLVVTLGVHTNLGALFGAVASKPLWSSHLLPLHFIVSAVLVGAAFQILFMSATYMLRTGNVPDELKKLFSNGYRPLVIGLIIVNFVLIAIKYIPGAFSAETSPYLQLLVAGSFGFLFWGLEIVIGGIAPLIILLRKKTRESTSWLIAACALVVIGVYFSKYNLLVAGQSIGPVFTKNFIPYSPSAPDVLLLIGGMAVCLLFYTLGELLLPLNPEETPGWFVFAKRGLSV